QFEVRYAAFNPDQALGIKLKAAAKPDGVLVQFGVNDADGLRQRSARRHVSPQRTVPKVRYADVAGQDTALAQIKNVVELPLRHAGYFAALGAEPQSGIILYGPPGNGKTLLAKAVATECNAHLEMISGPEILSRWVGQSEKNLRTIF